LLSSDYPYYAPAKLDLAHTPKDHIFFTAGTGDVLYLAETEENVGGVG
jgi:hypothetical protein